ncbi:MAG: PilN domain-containing protein [Planctomycetota bacterium]
MMNVDFLPERIVQQRARRSRQVRQGCLLGICLVALAALGFARQGQVRQARAERRVWTSRSENVRQQVALRRKLERQQAELAMKEQIDRRLGIRISARDLLAELSRLLPESMCLTGLDIEAVRVADARNGRSAGRARPVRRPPEDAPTTASLRVVIRGLAPNDVDVANFIGRLSACPLFTSVRMGYTRTVQFRRREAREFEASFSVVQ